MTNPTTVARSIWIISKYAAPKKYGFESRHVALAREFVSQGRRPLIISSDSNHLAEVPDKQKRYWSEIVDGVPIFWIKTFKYKKTASIARVLSWFDFELKLMLMNKKYLEKPDVVIVSSLSLLTILNGLLLRRQYGCRLVFEIRDIWPLTLVVEGNYSEKSLFVRFLAWVEKLGYSKADMIVGTMPNLTAHVESVVGVRRPCKCIPFGFDPGFFKTPHPLPDGFVERYIPKNRFIVGYAGSMGLTNALETIIECARQMVDDERFFFLFIGSGDMREKFISQTADLPNVAFAPRVSRQQVQSVLAHCDLLYFAVYDSPVWRYGMSLNKLIDYMMAAKPIIASYSGYQSMIDEAGCGGFVPSADVDALKAKLLEYLALPQERLLAMGNAGRRWLEENRTWSAVAIKYLELCDDLVDKL